MMRRTEDHHHKDEDVLLYVRKALALVAEVEPPEALAAAVFTAAVNLYAAKQLFYEQASPLGIDLNRLGAYS